MLKAKILIFVCIIALAQCHKSKIGTVHMQLWIIHVFFNKLYILQVKPIFVDEDDDTEVEVAVDGNIKRKY